jgi:hypothetical protein
LSPSFLFGYVTILAVMADKYKSKFGHIRHIECEVGHTIYGVIQLFIVTILADKSQKVKSTRRNSGKFLCVSYHIRHARLRRAAFDHSFKNKYAAAIKFTKQNQSNALPLTKKV